MHQWLSGVGIDHNLVVKLNILLLLDWHATVDKAGTWHTIAKGELRVGHKLLRLLESVLAVHIEVFLWHAN